MAAANSAERAFFHPRPPPRSEPLGCGFGRICSLTSISSVTIWRRGWHSAIWARVSSSASRGNGTRAGVAADPGRDDPLGAVAAGPGLGALAAGAAAFVVALDELAGAQVCELVDLRQQFLAVILQRRIA